LEGGGRRPGSTKKTEFTIGAALDGLRFVYRAPLIRSTMLLVFFAMFFSSSTALLPIYAQDILGVGASGYGWLYAAPAAGAILTSAVMVKAVDVIDHRGRVLVAAVRWAGHDRVRGSRSRAPFACLRRPAPPMPSGMVFRNPLRQPETRITCAGG
jgi:hypothetical protein